VYAVRLTAKRLAWAPALAAPLDARPAARLDDLFLGVLLSRGRRTAAS
jgi:hypothetical protein